jgi:hypothetical protein
MGKMTTDKLLTTQKTNIAHQRVIFWLCIAVAAPVFPLFVGVIHFLPPPSPSLSAAEIASMFQSKTVAIRAACVCFLIATAAFIPIFFVFAHQLQRIRGLNPVVLPYSQMMLGTFGAVAAFMSCIIWCGAAFRPDTISPELLRTLNDIAWFFFMCPIFVVGQCFCVAAAVLSDSSSTPVFPRWFGYLSLWVGVSDLPAALIVFFKTGPLAWNGLISFWFVVIMFMAWTVCMLVLIYKAIRQEERELTLSDAVPSTQPV